MDKDFQAIPASAFVEAEAIADELAALFGNRESQGPGNTTSVEPNADEQLDSLLHRVIDVTNRHFLVSDYSEILEDKGIASPFVEILEQINSLTERETRAILSMCVRSDRFVEGNLNGFARQGVLGTALRRLAELGTPSTFPKSVEEQLQHYVYALADPGAGDQASRIFYVGKGVGNRVFAHAQAAVDPSLDGVMDAKLDRIRAIQNKGRRVLTYIIRHKIPTEAQAFDIEASVIDALKLANLLEGAGDSLDLTNKVSGHGSSTIGLMSASSVVAEYLAEPAPEITDPALLIRISRSWTPTHGAAAEDHDLYEATRKWWVLGPRRENARYAFAVSRGIVRAVYEITPKSWKSGVYGKRLEKWRAPRTGDKGVRWSFEGEQADDMQHFVGTDVSRYFTAGAQSPITYVNC